METIAPKAISNAANPSVPPAETQTERPFTPYVSDLARTPYLSWTTSAILLASVPAVVKAPLAGWPYLAQLPLFAAVFGGTGYMTSVGDLVNGPGTTTAWTGIYLFLNAKKAILSKRPGPLALSSTIAFSGAIHGWDYFQNA